LAAASDLATLAELSAKLGTPFFLPGIALALLQDAMRVHGPEASLGKLTFGFEA
jgi:hypothetical protein